MVSLALTHNLLQTCRQHGADRSILFRRQDPSLAQQIGVQFERNIGFHIEHAFMCSTILRAIAVRRQLGRNPLKPRLFPQCFAAISGRMVPRPHGTYGPSELALASSESEK